MLELEKARLKDERPAVQPTPLEPPPHFYPPVGDLATAAPPQNDFHPIDSTRSTTLGVAMVATNPPASTPL
jgi:hypothetical protein